MPLPLSGILFYLSVEKFSFGQYCMSPWFAGILYGEMGWERAVGMGVWLENTEDMLRMEKAGGTGKAQCSFGCL